MKNLSLRLRIFLFFCLIALGSIAVTLLALWLGYRQLGAPDAFSAFLTSAIVSSFGIAGLAVFIWLLFDENVSKPIEALAAHLRVCTHAGIDGGIDTDGARHLGDLGPAAAALGQKLSAAAKFTTETVAQQTERLKRQRQQLLQVLSDIPMAIIVVNPSHHIVFYDGQAADLMDRETAARLNGSIFDYLDQAPILQALNGMEKHDNLRLPIAVPGHSGALYSGHIRRFGALAGYTLMLEPLAPDAERPPTCDLDLLDQSQPTDLHDTPLRDLTFVVFDSETTGLNPMVDDVVQLGAVRIVNNKCVAGEVFDTLVNPGRPIPAASTKVHGISDQMVAGAPLFPDICRRFHAFTNDAVIVVHNTPFDMAFLHRQSKTLELRFDHPTLDTVHLSAVVFGGSAEHTLDALCARLDVKIPPEQRHTAIGDAVATAKVFIAMVLVLEARGIATLGQVYAEIQKHRRIMKKQGQSY